MSWSARALERAQARVRGARRADSDENRALLPGRPRSTDTPQVPLTPALWPHTPWMSTLKSWSSSPATLVATQVSPRIGDLRGLDLEQPSFAEDADTLVGGHGLEEEREGTGIRNEG